MLLQQPDSARERLRPAFSSH